MQDISFMLDLWNWYLKGIMTAKEDWKNILLWKEMIRTKWMRKWRILDMDDFTYSIRSLLDSFEKKLWWDYFDDVTIWVSHPEMLVKRVTEQKRIVWDKILQEDVDHLSNLIYDTAWVQNYETIKIIPVNWIIDDDIKLKDPTWMEWKKLEIVADVFMIPKNFYNTLIEAFDKLELDVNDIVPNILWSSEVALDFDSKDLWTLLIDIWSNQTSFSIYEEGYPLLYWVVPIWWEEVTKDISIWMQLDIKEAEKLKKERWYIYTDDETIQEDDNIDISFLSDIIAARYEEIFDHINKHLIELWKDSRLPWWVILVWWWAKMANLDKLSKLQFKLATWYWKDNLMKLWELSSNLQYVNVIWVNYWFWKYGWIIWWWFSIWISFSWLKKLWKYIKDMF